MKDEESQPPKSSPIAKKDGSETSGTWRARYKFWALSAILLLALWSMLTASLTLKWSAGNLNPLSDDFDSPLHYDLDILEVEEREKVVRRMWDVYTHTSKIRLPSFWQEAFEAAYEDLISDAPLVRNAAVSEIAKMSLMSLDVQLTPVQKTITSNGRSKTTKQAKKDEEASASTTGTSAQMIKR